MLRFLWLSGFSVGVEGLSENEKAVIEEFGYEIYDHCSCKHKIFVRAGVSKRVRPPGGKGREHDVEQGHLGHGYGDVARRVECEFSVEGEIPKNGQSERDEITEPMGRRGELFQNRKRRHLYNACAYREKKEFQRTNQFLFACVHRATSLDGIIDYNTLIV